MIWFVRGEGPEEWYSLQWPVRGTFSLQASGICKRTKRAHRCGQIFKGQTSWLSDLFIIYS